MSSARMRRARRREAAEGELMLAAMVDMMINILLFLLTLYGTSAVTAPPGDPIRLPGSTARDPIAPRVTVAISEREVFVDGKAVVALVVGGTTLALPDAALDHGMVPALATALAAATPTPAEEGAAPELLVQCDRRVPWSVLGPLLHTAERAGFAATRFVVRQTGPGEPPG